MFENILTKENVSFKDLEEIVFKIACLRTGIKNLIKIKKCYIIEIRLFRRWIK